MLDFIFYLSNPIPCLNTPVSHEGGAKQNLNPFFPHLSLLLRMKHETWATSVSSVPWAPTSPSPKHFSTHPRTHSAFLHPN